MFTGFYRPRGSLTWLKSAGRRFVSLHTMRILSILMEKLHRCVMLKLSAVTFQSRKQRQRADCHPNSIEQLLPLFWAEGKSL